MVIDIRYQIITTVIIFLTLAMGILIGSSMVGQEGVVEKQKELISHLEEDFLEIRSQNQQLQEEVQLLEGELESNREFQQQLFPLAVEDRLADKRALILYEEEELEDLAWDLTGILEMAGSEEVQIKLRESFEGKLAEEADYYLVYLNHQDLNEEELDFDFKNQFKELIHFSEEDFKAKQALIESILKLDGAIDNKKRSVSFD
ncbi:copper transporter [Fuchsiella alkaliacetigena]|uniref:copper transporter n=1 Tax=Fuchsiella alkaliacetigena TaxID=957042 RepID=UPI00200B0143|nr:copper transporter [Fuchsiella alkaliacetigena]MCK8824743.1 copper transporter [Fuchsiella alkaliacetigena]